MELEIAERNLEDPKSSYPFGLFTLEGTGWFLFSVIHFLFSKFYFLLLL